MLYRKVYFSVLKRSMESKNIEQMCRMWYSSICSICRWNVGYDDVFPVVGPSKYEKSYQYMSVPLFHCTALHSTALHCCHLLLPNAITK